MTKASVFKILTSEPDMEGLDAEQGNLVSKMLEKEPRQRATAESLLDNIEAMRAGEKPKLQIGAADKFSSGAGVTKTVERSFLEQAIQAAASSSGTVSMETSAHAHPDLPPKNPRNRKSSATLVALSAVLLVSSAGIFFANQLPSDVPTPIEGRGPLAAPIPISSEFGATSYSTAQTRCVEEELAAMGPYLNLYANYLESARLTGLASFWKIKVSDAAWESKVADLIEQLHVDSSQARDMAGPVSTVSAAFYHDIQDAHADLILNWEKVLPLGMSGSRHESTKGANGFLAWQALRSAEGTLAHRGKITPTGDSTYADRESERLAVAACG